MPITIPKTKPEVSELAGIKTPECIHCGLPCYDIVADAEGLSFCCNGCASVYHLLNETNMCRYYEEGKGIKPESADVNDLEYLDVEETYLKFVVFSHSDTVQFKFRIPGMHCNSCIYLLERLEKFNPDIISSRVDFFNKELLVSVAKRKNILSAVVSLLYQLGYKPDLSLSGSEANSKKSRFSQRSIKIGKAGF